MNVSSLGTVGPSQASNHSPEASQPANKPKRVRTGCLTCRERHLKCDEGLPICQNCRKSNRQCKRGIRLNFIDTNVRAPPTMAPTHDWTVNFLDESRDIASEYKGGLARYGIHENKLSTGPLDSGVSFDFAPGYPPAPIPSHRSLPSISGMLPESYSDDPAALPFDGRPSRQTHHSDAQSHPESAYTASNIQQTPAPSNFGNPDHSGAQTPSQGREYMESPEEVLFMQVFVEEVGLWMDSFDAIKHVSEGNSALVCLSAANAACSFLSCFRFTHYVSPCCTMHSSLAVPGIWLW